MTFSGEDDGIECRIIESYGVFSRGINFWNKEINLVSWNGMPAKLDIRNWRRDHEKCGKGIALTREEAEKLYELLGEILKRRAESGSGGGQKRETPRRPKVSGKRKGARSSGASAKTEHTERPEVPESLKPFYRELKIPFGAESGLCKTARNTLLKKYHPDMYAGSAAYATGKTIKIKEAYERILAWWKAANI